MLQTGDFPSGEAQRAAETRFLKKIEDRQGAFGTAWQDVIKLCSAGDRCAERHAQTGLA